MFDTAEFKIISIKKRRFSFLCFSKWKVRVDYRYKIYTFNCWAGPNNMDAGALLVDTECQLRKALRPKPKLEIFNDKLKKLTGSKREITLW